jgi:hypothetical protein
VRPPRKDTKLWKRHCRRMDRLVGSEVLESKGQWPIHVFGGSVDAYFVCWYHTVVALYKLPHIPARALESQVVVAYFLVAIRVSVWGRDIQDPPLSVAPPSPSYCTRALLITQLLMGCLNFTVGHRESVSSRCFERRWPIYIMM